MSGLHVAWRAASPAGFEGMGRVCVDGVEGLTPSTLRGWTAAAFAAVAGPAESEQVEAALRKQLTGLLPPGAELRALSLELYGEWSGEASAPQEPGLLARATSGLAGALFKLALALGLLAGAGFGIHAAWQKLRTLAAAPSAQERTAFEEHYRAGLEFLTHGRFAEASAAFDEALAQSPAELRALEGRARALLRQARWAAARADLDAALSQEGIAVEQRIDLLRMRAEARLQSEDYAGALTDAREVMQARPRDADTNWFAARAYIELEQAAKAVPLLDLVVEVRPEHHAARFRRGVARHRAQDFEGAIDDYEAVLLFLPKHRLAKRHLSQARQGLPPS